MSYFSISLLLISIICLCVSIFCFFYNNKISKKYKELLKTIDENIYADDLTNKVNNLQTENEELEK